MTGQVWTALSNYKVSKYYVSTKPDRARRIRHKQPETAHKRQPSNHDPLDLIEAKLVAAAIVQLRRPRRRMVRHRRSLFERAAFFR
jgi:hypothetical protein